LIDVSGNIVTSNVTFSVGTTSTKPNAAGMYWFDTLANSNVTVTATASSNVNAILF